MLKDILENLKKRKTFMIDGNVVIGTNTEFNSITVGDSKGEELKSNKNEILNWVKRTAARSAKDLRDYGVETISQGGTGNIILGFIMILFASAFNDAKMDELENDNGIEGTFGKDETAANMNIVSFKKTRENEKPDMLFKRDPNNDNEVNANLTRYVNSGVGKERHAEIIAGLNQIDAMFHDRSNLKILDDLMKSPSAMKLAARLVENEDCASNVSEDDKKAISDALRKGDISTLNDFQKGIAATHTYHAAKIEALNFSVNIKLQETGINSWDTGILTKAGGNSSAIGLIQVTGSTFGESYGNGYLNTETINEVAKGFKEIIGSKRVLNKDKFDAAFNQVASALSRFGHTSENIGRIREKLWDFNNDESRLNRGATRGDFIALAAKMMNGSEEDIGKFYRNTLKSDRLVYGITDDLTALSAITVHMSDVQSQLVTGVIISNVKHVEGINNKWLNGYINSSDDLQSIGKAVINNLGVRNNSTGIAENREFYKDDMTQEYIRDMAYIISKRHANDPAFENYKNSDPLTIIGFGVKNDTEIRLQMVDQRDYYGYNTLDNARDFLKNRFERLKTALSFNEFGSYAYGERKAVLGVDQIVQNLKNDPSSTLNSDVSNREVPIYSPSDYELSLEGASVVNEDGSWSYDAIIEAISKNERISDEARSDYIEMITAFKNSGYYPNFRAAPNSTDTEMFLNNAVKLYVEDKNRPENERRWHFDSKDKALLIKDAEELFTSAMSNVNEIAKGVDAEGKAFRKDEVLNLDSYTVKSIFGKEYTQKMKEAVSEAERQAKAIGLTDESSVDEAVRYHLAKSVPGVIFIGSELKGVNDTYAQSVANGGASQNVSFLDLNKLFEAIPSKDRTPFNVNILKLAAQSYENKINEYSSDADKLKFVERYPFIDYISKSFEQSRDALHNLFQSAEFKKTFEKLISDKINLAGYKNDNDVFSLEGKSFTTLRLFLNDPTGFYNANPSMGSKYFEFILNHKDEFKDCIPQEAFKAFENVAKELSGKNYDKNYYYDRVAQRGYRIASASESARKAFLEKNGFVEIDGVMTPKIELSNDKTIRKMQVNDLFKLGYDVESIKKITGVNNIDLIYKDLSMNLEQKSVEYAMYVLKNLKYLKEDGEIELYFPKTGLTQTYKVSDLQKLDLSDTVDKLGSNRQSFVSAIKEVAINGGVIVSCMNIVKDVPFYNLVEKDEKIEFDIREKLGLFKDESVADYASRKGREYDLREQFNDINKSDVNANNIEGSKTNISNENKFNNLGR